MENHGFDSDGLVKVYPKIINDREELLKWCNAKESRKKNYGEYPKVLPEKYFEWLTRRKKSPRKKRSNVEKSYFSQIRWVVARQLADISKLAQLLPEDDRDIVFTANTLENLLETVLCVYDERINEPIVKNTRVLRIAAMMIQKIKLAGKKGLIRSPLDVMLMDTIGTYDFARIVPVVNRFREAFR
jgi:hypothetical protein